MNDPQPMDTADLRPAGCTCSPELEVIGAWPPAPGEVTILNWAHDDDCPLVN